MPLQKLIPEVITNMKIFSNSSDQLLLDPNKIDIKDILKQNMVVIIFIILTLCGIYLSDLPFSFMVRELVTRITRNSFLVLSLIIPILAGIGLNFGIVVGAMAGQMALITITYWQIPGPLGILLTIVIATPIAIFLGFLTAGLYNRTKGQEMIAGLIVSFFAQGLYQFLFLFIVGKVIKLEETPMLKPDGIGLRNTISMGSKHGEGIKYSLDYLLRINLWHLIIILAVIAVAIKIFNHFKLKSKIKILPIILYTLSILVSLFILLSPGLRMLANIKAPVITWMIIAGLCLFTKWIMRTKLGQNFKAVGQSQHISSVAGINVNKTRMIAVIISTVLASWGQIILLQNIGTMNTYGSHMQIGLFSIAAILIGGATVSKATIRHALIGVVLFHSISIVSPTAGKALFGDDAQIGEFFRNAIMYGVIGVSLALHAWKNTKKQNKLY